MTELTSNTFDNFVASGVVLVDFYATWCGPCRSMEPSVAKVTKSRGIKLGKVDVDKAQSLSSRYEVTSLPTLILFKDGQIRDMKVGAMNERALTEWLSRASS